MPWHGLRLAVLGGVFLLALGLSAPMATLARAADLSIAAFFGHWKGTALSESEISIYFRLTARDIDVVVGPHGQGGFQITWSTVQRQKGNPDAPKEILKRTTAAFTQSGRGNVFRSAAADPMALGGYRWARLGGNSLYIYSMAIRPDGAYEMQVYKRTLSGLGMALEFRRIIDGELARTAKGCLIKFAD